jgi:hypothetical protein
MAAGAGRLPLLPPLILQCHAVPPEPADENGRTAKMQVMNS